MITARYIPENARKVADKLSGATAYLYTRAGRPCAMIYATAKTTTAKGFYFPTEAKRDAYVARELRAWREAFQRKQAYKAERAAERAKGHTLEVGHILYSSWGYEQTNIDFFQVVAVPSKCFVEVRPIGSIRTEDGPNYTGKVVPNIDSFKGPSQRCRADARNAVKIDRHYAGLWHGRPVAYSAYY